MSFRRYEIILPTRYNDGTAIEPEKVLLTNRELSIQFGPASFLPEPVRGIWIHQGQWFEEANVRLFYFEPCRSAAPSSAPKPAAVASRMSTFGRASALGLQGLQHRGSAFCLDSASRL